MSLPVFMPRRAAAGGGALPVSDANSAQPRSKLDRGREAAALLLFASGVFVALALASFRGDPADAGVHGADWVGPVGAEIASSLVGLLGVVAWGIVVELFAFGVPLLRGRPSIANLARLAGDIIVALIVAALLHVAAPSATAFGAMPLGGAFGELFGELLRSLFSNIGSYIIGLTVIGLILINRASFSFIAWVQRAGRTTEKAAEKAAAGAKAVAGAWARAKELEKQRAERAARAKKAADPTIKESHDEQAIIAVLTEDEANTPTPPRVRLATDTEIATPPLLLRDAPTPAPPPVRPAKKKASAPKKEKSPPSAAPTVNEAVAETASEPPESVPAKPVPEATPTEPARAMAATAATDELPAADETALSKDIELPAVEELSPSPVVAEKPKAPKPEASKKREKEPEAGPVIVDTKPQQETRKSDTAKLVPAVGEGFRLPPTALLEPPPEKASDIDDEQLRENARLLEKVLGDYGVQGKVEEIHPGPTVTTYEVTPAAGTKVSKVSSLAADLALGLSRKVRIIAPIPGKNRIGFELPNESRSPVSLRELIEDERFMKLKAPLPVVLGRDQVGAPYFADLASMPHVIVAGATGAGKSVGLNVMLTSILYRRTPEELRLLMIDPKVVELAPFDGIPHMLLPVVTDMKQASNALKWAVDEMERRYQLFANAGTKNIGTYNAWVERVRRGEAKAPKVEKVQAIGADGEPVEIDAAKDGSDQGLPEKLPFIVIVVDEFADLMMQQGKEVEASVARLAQKARAAGMHVILATQRPSVDVITGVIKANFPTRIAYRVAQQVDSKTILDEVGAEHLLGKGDMLVKMNGTIETRRVQCPFISEEEVQQVTDFLRLQGSPVYDESILKPREEDGGAAAEDDGELDPLYDQAVRIVAETGRCSTSWLQRKLEIGYNRAARLVETMEKQGIVGPPNGAREREILISAF